MKNTNIELVELNTFLKYAFIYNKNNLKNKYYYEICSSF